LIQPSVWSTSCEESQIPRYSWSHASTPGRKPLPTSPHRIDGEPNPGEARASSPGIHSREPAASPRLLARGPGGRWHRQRRAGSAPALPLELLRGFRHWPGRAQHRSRLPRAPGLIQPPLPRGCLTIQPIPSLRPNRHRNRRENNDTNNSRHDHVRDPPVPAATAIARLHRKAAGPTRQKWARPISRRLFRSPNPAHRQPPWAPAAPSARHTEPGSTLY
jgi:hypothetical protein